MAYVAPRTWATSDLVTAAMMNQDVRDNMIYVKAKVDTIYTATFAEPVRAKNVEYQNSTKIRIVTIAASGASGDNLEVRIGAASPAATRVAYENTDVVASCTFVVPANWYYNTFAPPGLTLQEWIEWDLF